MNLLIKIHDNLGKEVTYGYSSLPRIAIMLIILGCIGVPLLLYYNELNKHINDFAFSLSIATLIYTIIFHLDNREYTQNTSFDFRIEKIKAKENKLIIETKNIGSSNISSARIIELKINGAEVIHEKRINFLVTNETVEFEIEITQENCLDKIYYKSCVLLNRNKYLLVSEFEQKMKFTGNDEYIIETNTCCEFKRTMYYRLFSI